MDMWCVSVGVRVRMAMIWVRMLHRLLARLHVQMIAFCVDEPIHRVMLALWPTATRTREKLRRGRVDGESEQVGRLAEVGDEAFVEEEVDQDTDIHEEDEEEDDHPAFGVGVDAAGGVLLGGHGGVEVLGLEVVEEGVSKVLFRVSETFRCSKDGYVPSP